MRKTIYEKPFDIEWKYEEYTYLNRFIFTKDEMGFSPFSIARKGQKLNVPKVLYRFYGKNLNNLEALSNGYLYFSSPRNFNDPFDCLTNREEFIIKGGAAIEKHRNEIGICSFSLIRDNPLMWGHYTNNYTGYCLKFKNDTLLNSNDIQLKTHVSYLKNYRPSNDNLKKVIGELKNAKLKKHEKDQVHRILVMLFEYCWKYYDWKYEQEFRALSWTTKRNMRKFHFNKEDVEEIYIGHKMKDKDLAYYNLLMDVLKSKYPTTKIFQVKPHPLIVKLEFAPIN